MTKKGAPGRNLYVRITENGQRKYVNVGLIFKSGRVVVLKGMPKPGWWKQ